MRTEFANICLDVVKKDPKAVIFLGDISHFLLAGCKIWFIKSIWNLYPKYPNVTFLPIFFPCIFINSC